MHFPFTASITPVFIAGLVACLAFHPARAAGPPAPIDPEALVARIVSENPEIDFYRDAIEAARADTRVAGSLGDPGLSLEIGRKRVTDIAGNLAGEGTAWAVSVSQTFEWPGRLALRKAIANHDLALAELGLARFEASLAARARTLVFSLHAARQRAAATDEVAARYRALRELFLAREPGGITPLLEARVIEAEEIALQRRATDTRLAALAAQVELNLLRGHPADAPIPLAGVTPVFGRAPSIDEALAAAAQNHFEFRAARIELEQQETIVSLARNERHPSVTVSPYYSDERAGERERAYGIGVSLPLPLSPGGGARVSSARIRERQAGAALAVARREMEREVIAATQRFAAKLEEMRAWAPDAGERFREAAALADRHYRLGAVPIGTYVELQDAYLEAIDSLYETRIEAIESGQRLEILTGLDLDAVEVAP